MAINMANADYLSFFLSNELEPIGANSGQWGRRSNAETDIHQNQDGTIGPVNMLKCAVIQDILAICHEIGFITLYNFCLILQEYGVRCTANEW